MALALETVTGTLRQPDTLTPLVGIARFSPQGGVLVDATNNQILAGAYPVVTDAFGRFSVPLPPTDAAGIQPAANTWNWHVEFDVPGVTLPAFNFALLTGSGPVDLADVMQVAPLSGEYVLVPGPTGHTPRFYSSVGAPTTLHTDGDITITDAGAVYQQITGAWAATGSNIRGPAGSGGGGSTIKTRSVRITDDNLSGLPAAASWTVVVTSGGTHLQCSIPAAAGDRIRMCPNFMRVGGHFLDFVLLDNTGAISRYASTESSSPGPEGDPAEYPLLTEEYVTSSDMFTVGSGHIDGSGNATIGVAHQGASTGSSNIVYAHPSYPWRMRLENIGPEPA